MPVSTDRLRSTAGTSRTSVIAPVLPSLTIDEHKLTFEELLERFGPVFSVDDPRQGPGLGSDQVLKSRRENGPNHLPIPKRPPLIVSYFKQMANLFSFVLLLCGALSIVVFIIEPSYWINLYTGLLFWGVAFFNAALEFWQAYSSAKTLEGFLGLVPASTLVMRDGKLEEVSAADIVKGDLIMIKTGNKIPADARILWSDNIRVDNSSLTGESEPQERSAQPSDSKLLEASNLLFSGTIIISGEALALVIKVGAQTVIGRLAQYAITAPQRISQLEREMTIVFRRLVACAGFFAILALAIGFGVGGHVADVLSTTIGIFISFLPQGLPATLTILLTAAAKRMAARNVLVKELRSVETLGAMTVLATDKTGTLTQNKMAAVGGWIYGTVYNSVEELDANVSNLGEFFDSIALCTSCKLETGKAKQPIEERTIFGDATEVGILQYAGKFKDIDHLFADNPRQIELPFNSTTKWHAVVHKIGDEFVLIMKGAPERILTRCSSYRRGVTSVPVDDALQQEFNRTYEYFAAKGLRIIAVAKLNLARDKYPPGFEFHKDPPNFPTEDLEFLGLMCLRDPPKPGVAWAINRLRDAGVMVMMVTGDHPLTAEAIGRQVEILTETNVFRRPPSASDLMQKPAVKAAVIHGEDLESMTTSDWRRLSGMKEIIFARTAPRHKLEIVKQMQTAGHVVAVCGDGVNDSPALRKANLGISMNKTASDVSKDAAHMILLDDNFVSVVAGVFEGRLIFENVKKSVRYTFTHITTEVSALLIYVLLIIPPPLSPILLIFIDVFAELGPAVSFAGEPPEYDLMVLPPRNKVKPTLSADRKMTMTFRKLRLPGFMQWLLVKITVPFYLPFVGENLVDWDLACWSFLEGGIVVALGAWGAYVITLIVEKVPLDMLFRSDLIYFGQDSPDLTLTDETVADAEAQLVILGRLQAAFFMAILIVQWFNVFIQKHRYRYPVGKDMLVNKLTYVGIFCAMVVAAVVAYIPGLNYVFGTDIPPALALAPPVTAGIFLFIYEFIRRSLRHRGYFGGVPDKRVLKEASEESAIQAPTTSRARELSVYDRPRDFDSISRNSATVA